MIDPIKTALGRSDDCPPLEALDAAPAGSDTARHLAGCAYCRNELALLQQFESAEVQPHELASVEWISSQLHQRASAVAVAEPRESAWSRMAGWLAATFVPSGPRALAAAAAVLLVVGSAIYLRQGSEGPRPVAGDAPVWRSGSFAAVSPSGEVSQAPSEFRWEPVPNAAAYRIQLMEVDRTVIWSAESAETAINIPQEIRAQLNPGRAFRWQVTAKDRGGQTIAATDLQTLHIVITSR